MTLTRVLLELITRKHCAASSPINAHQSHTTVAVVRCAVVCGRLPSKLEIVRPSVGDGDLVIRQWAVCPALLLLRILLLRILLRQIICLLLLRPRQFYIRTSIHVAATKGCYGDAKNENGSHDKILLACITRGKAAGSGEQEDAPELDSQHVFGSLCDIAVRQAG